MADVTSTAKLVVTVEGEDKVKKLAASLKALAGAGGTKKIGVGGGTTGLASQVAATHIAVKRSLAPMVAAQAVTARLMAPIVAQQAVMAKAMAPITAAQTSMAKTVAPMIAAQAAASKLAKAMPTAKPSVAELAAGMAIAEKARAAVLARKPERFGEQGPGPTGVTDKFIASMRKRGALGTDEEIRARIANPPAGTFPLNKKEHAERAARGLPPAAGLAEGGAGAGTAGLGALGRIGVGVGVVGVLGAATAALAALAATAGAVSAGVWAANKALEAAKTTSQGIWDNLGKAKAAGKTVDEVQDRGALRDALFGGKAGALENRLPKLITDQKRKKGIAGDKGIFGTLGLDRKTMADMEKKGEADATGVLTRIGDKRSALEEKLAAAKLPKQKAALEQQLRAFDKSMNLFLGKPLADAVRGLPKGAARKFADDMNAINTAFDKVTPKTTARQLEQQAAAHQAAQFRAEQIEKKRQDAIGKIALPAATRFQDAKNDINQALSPAFAQITGNLGRLALDAGTAILKALPTDKIAAAAGQVGKYLADLKLEDIPTELGKAFTAVKDSIKEAFSFENMKAGAQSAIDNQKALWSDLGTSVGDVLTGLLNKVRAIIGLKPIETEAERKAREAAEPVKFKKPEQEAPATFKERFGEFAPAQAAPDTSAADRVREAFEALPAKAAEAGETFKSTVESGMGAAGTTGGNAFSTAAGTGISAAGTTGGQAFASAINPSSIGAAIGAAAASAISAAKVNVNVNVSGAGGRDAKPSNGGDGPSKGAGTD